MWLAAVHYRGAAKGLKPATDIDLGMTFPAKVQSMRFVRFGRIPFVDAESGVAAVDDEPTHRRRALKLADFTFIDGTYQGISSRRLCPID
jgi:hypothetical protein